MARTATITKLDVFEAAEQLKASGKPVTQARVRDEIGGGSFSTIGPFLKEWEEGQAASQEARDNPVPESISAALGEVAGRIWKIATEEAAIGIEAARREVEELKRGHTDSIKGLQEAIEIVEGERDAAQEKADELAADIDALRADLRVQSEGRARAEAEAAAAIARADRADEERAAADARTIRAEERADRAEERADGIRAEMSKMAAALAPRAPVVGHG